MHDKEGIRFLATEKQSYRKEKNPKKLYCAHPFPEPKSFAFKPKKAKNLKGKASFSNFSRTKPNKNKKKGFFSSYFSFKIAFKSNKGQESQVSSQDHHD